ncbi:MAG: hypothetical protein WBP55_09580, partial [Solirubrobacterales bacterium]
MLSTSDHTRSADHRKYRIVTGLLFVSLFAICALAFTQGLSHAAPQGSWALPATDLSATSFEGRNPQVATGPDGTTIAVWQGSNGSESIIQAAVRPPGGSFGTTADLSATGEDAERPQVAIGPDGTATVVWRGSDGSNYIIQAATRPPGGSFGAPVDLSAAGQDAEGQQIAIGPDGTATVIWYRSNGTYSIIQSATRPPGGTFSAPADLSVTGGDALYPRVAIGPDGTATAVWHRFNGTFNIVQAATRPPGGSFGGRINISGSGQDAFDPQLAIGPDGTAVAVWT